jgi:hypothetical protein
MRSVYIFSIKNESLRSQRFHVTAWHSSIFSANSLPFWGRQMIKNDNRSLALRQNVFLLYGCGYIGCVL